MWTENSTFFCERMIVSIFPLRSAPDNEPIDTDKDNTIPTILTFIFTEILLYESI